MFGIDYKDLSPQLFSFKIAEPGIRSVIYMESSFLKLNQVYIFFVVNGFPDAYNSFSSRLRVRREKLVNTGTAVISRETKVLGRVLLGLFRNRITRNRRYLYSFGSYSVFGMNGISFRSFCSR